jgi:hypothetical protein
MRDEAPQKVTERKTYTDTNIVSGGALVDAETLRLLASRMRAIASDCFDLGAAQRIRVLSEELEKMTKRAADLSSSGPRPPISN